MDRVSERFLQPARDQRVELPQEGSQRLSCACRRKNERVLARRDRGPALALRIAGFSQRFGEPLPYDGVKATQHTFRGQRQYAENSIVFGCKAETSMLQQALELLRSPFLHLIQSRAAF